VRLVEEQLERILSSRIFHNSEQHRLLLAYLTRCSREGHADELKEYSVGIDALGKPESYSPRQDATVRIQTGRLRSRLEEYYRTEGAADPLVFIIPKGGFKVLFASGPAAVAAATGAPAQRVVLWRRLSVALLVLLVAACALLWRQSVQLGRAERLARMEARVWSPELQALWLPFLEDNRPLTLSLGAPLFVNMDGIPVRDSAENQWAPGHLSPRLEAIRRSLNAHDVQPVYRYNGFGETAGAFHLFRLFLSRGKDLNFRRSNDLAWDDFKEHDVILLGSPKSVSHLQYFRDLGTRLVFQVEGEEIVNTAPRPGELARYRKPELRGEAGYDTFAVVTRLPGLDGGGNIVILGSPDTEGTLAACEYVTNPSLVKELVRSLAPPGEPLPPAFQVLLKITVRNAVPVTTTRVVTRLLDSIAPPR
jgi:hypothetical protein